MGTRADDLSDFLDTLTVFWGFWPDEYNKNTGTAAEVEAALFEQWRIFKTHIKRDIERLEAFEAKLIEGVNLHKMGHDREGAILLQREIANNRELRDLR